MLVGDFLEMGEIYDDEELLYEPEPEEVESPRDVKIDEAKHTLMEELFGKEHRKVFYGQQVRVLFEKDFYHWITGKALIELTDEGKIDSVKIPLYGETPIRFYWSKKNRYWKRQVQRSKKLVMRFSGTDIGRAIGRQAEMLFDAALPTVGFMPVARKVQEYEGRRWEKTEHDLDRVYTRDGVAYGAEIKNRLGYIGRDELETKIEMCEELGLKPLFILRFAAKSYVEIVRKAGGFLLMFKWQLYPFGQEELAKEVRERLRLPVDCPSRIEDGTVERFLKWHLKELGGV